MNILKRAATELKPKDFFPLSPMQEGMLFHTLHAPGSGVYIEQVCYRLRGGINIPAFEKAWQAVAERHPALRTFFIWEDVKNPIQAPREEAPIPFTQLDWRGLAQSQRQERLLDFLKSDRERGFQLTEAPLMRLALIRLEDELHEAIWTWHHLLMDGWSSSIVTQEVFSLYKTFCKREKPKLKESRPYRDYIVWLRKQDLSEAEVYWRNHLAGFNAPTPLIVDRGADGGRGEYRESHVRLSPELTEAIQAFTKRYRITINTLVQGAWAILLSRYSGEKDVLFGSVVSGRPVDLPGVESMVGLFINTLPARVKIDPEADVLAWLKKLQADQIESRRYEYTPLIEIEGWSSVSRNLPLFESLVLFENARYEAASSDVKAGDKDLSVERAINYEQLNYPLTLVAIPSSSMFLQIMYDSSRFSAATIERMFGHLETLFEAMIAPRQRRLASLNLLTEKESRQTVTEWNDTERKFDSARCLHQLFEAQAERSPSAVAVVFGNRQMTYGELNRRSNRLAAHLRSLGVGPEKVVAICMDRSTEMVISLLATLKAGGAYLPLDPAYPKKRLEYILNQANVCALLTERRLLETIPEVAASVVFIDEELSEIAALGDDNLENPAGPRNLAYIIYTSGSSGNPKGIQIPHRAVVNFLDSMREQPGLAGEDTLLAVTTLSFDIAGLEIFLPLAVGARLVVASREAASDGAQLLDLLDDQSVTVIQATPATCRMIIDAGWKGNKQLKILCGGEAFPPDLAERLAEMGGEVWNMYGPTETTIWSAAHKISKVSGGSAPTPIGRPIANTQIYLLDPNMRPVPIGATGELYIGGDGVARGYFNRPDLTAEKFIPDTFSAEAGRRLYTTGDSARYLEDGIVEYIGRRDFQLKVRGFRIEAGEIETALSAHPAVRESVVAAHGESSGDKYLVAYIAFHKGQEPAASDLRDFLKEKLPEYMIPSIFVGLEKLPLTPNGKIDRRALPAPAVVKAGRESGYVAPRSLIEHHLVKIWEGVFNRRPIGVTDGFFDLGGHSLLAIRAMAQIHKQFGRGLPLATLLECGTIEKLAIRLRQEIEPSSASPLVAIQPEGTKQPLFCAHPIGGQVMAYQQLAQALGKDQPLYGLQAPEFVHIGEEYISVEQMAEQYVAAVRELHPRGPYHLCGYSFGGYVAYEMARQLADQGEEVALLAIIDTWSPALYQVLPEEDDDAFLLTMLARVRARQDGKDLIISPEDIRHLSEEDRMRFVLEEVKKAEILPKDLADEIGVPYVRSYLVGYKTRQSAIFNYRPLVYPGKITLLRCLEEDQETLAALKKFGGDTSDPAFGWGELSTEAVGVHLVSGNHDQVLQAPNVEAIAHLVRTLIDGAAREARSHAA